MTWQISILLQTVLVALSMISLRVLARDKKTADASFAINAGMYAALYASMLLVAASLGGVHHDVLAEYWWRFIGGGVAFALTNVCTYKALVYFDAAIANIVATVNGLLAVIGAWLILGEALTVRQLIGAVILLTAVCYGLLATHAARKKAVRRSMLIGGMFALLAGVFFAIAAVNEKSLLGHMTIGSYMVYGVGGQFLMSVLAAVIVQNEKLPLLLKPDIAGWSLLSGALRGFGGACFIIAEVRSNNVGLVSVLANFRLIIVIIVGAWLLKERQQLRQKFVAAFTSMLGMAVLFWK